MVSPPPSPPPRGESARGSAAAAIFPPLRTHGARGRSAAAPPPPAPGPGKGPPCCRRRTLASAAAAARLRDRASATAPVRAPPPPPSPFVSSAPAPPPRLSLCRGRSARPQRAREKPRSARARLRGGPLLLHPTCARSFWPRAGAAWRAGGEVPGAFAGGAHLFARVLPPLPRKVEEGEAGRQRREQRAIQCGWGQICVRWCTQPSRHSEPGRGRVRWAHLRDYRAPGRHVWGVWTRPLRPASRCLGEGRGRAGAAARLVGRGRRPWSG